MSEANFDESGKMKIHSFGDFIEEHNKKYYEAKIEEAKKQVMEVIIEICEGGNHNDISDLQIDYRSFFEGWTIEMMLEGLSQEYKMEILKRAGVVFLG